MIKDIENVVMDVCKDIFHHPDFQVLRHYDTADEIACRVSEQLVGRFVPDEPVVRGLKLMLKHFEDRGHNWTEGTEFADAMSAFEWIKQIAPAQECADGCGDPCVCGTGGR